MKIILIQEELFLVYWQKEEKKKGGKQCIAYHVHVAKETPG